MKRWKEWKKEEEKSWWAQWSFIQSTEKVQRYYKYKYNTYNLHSAESKLVHRYFMISHMIIPSKSSGAILQVRSGSTAWHETHNCLGPVFLRSHRDLQEANASGHNAKQSSRYLVTIRKLPTSGLTEKRKFWLRLEERQMAVNRGLNSSFGLWRLWRATHANLKFWESWSSAD